MSWMIRASLQEGAQHTRGTRARAGFASDTVYRASSLHMKLGHHWNPSQSEEEAHAGGGGALSLRNVHVTCVTNRTSEALTVAAAAAKTVKSLSDMVQWSTAGRRGALFALSRGWLFGEGGGVACFRVWSLK
jgi:hypothetical protein